MRTLRIGGLVSVATCAAALTAIVGANYQGIMSIGKDFGTSDFSLDDSGAGSGHLAPQTDFGRDSSYIDRDGRYGLGNTGGAGNTTSRSSHKVALSSDTANADQQIDNHGFAAGDHHLLN